MSERSEAIPSDALADVAYLTRSENRIAILRALADGPTTRREISERTGCSRTTLDRIVNELESRGWAERTPDGTYVATPVGRHLIDQFDPFLRSVDALQRLGEAIDWLPTAELTVDLAAFSDATVRRPERDDPVETIEFMTDLVREASTFRVLTHLFPPEPLSEAMHEGLTSGRLSVQAVVPDGYMTSLREYPERRVRWHDNLRAGAVVYRYEGTLPCNLWIVDERVLIKQASDGPIAESYGVPIVSNNPAVRDWASDLIDRYVREGREIDPATFDESTTRTENR